MPNVDDELQSLIALYGQAIPPLPRQPRIATIRVYVDTTLEQYAQRVANDPRFEYQKDTDSMSALIRHALSLFLMALAQAVKDQTPSLMFQMEAIRRKQEDDQHKEFIDYAGAQIEVAQRTGKLGDQRRHILLRLIKSARTMRAAEYLVRHLEFRKLAQESGDERLQAWLEILS